MIIQAQTQKFNTLPGTVGLVGGVKAPPALRAVVLLAGSVRANQLRRATGRYAIEMPVSDHRTVMDCWREQLVAMAERFGIESLPVRVMTDRSSQMVPGETQYGPVKLSIETDPSDFRGTGGLLSDIAKSYDDDGYILVVHASQLLFEPLVELASSLAEIQADVGMVCNSQGNPSGLMLMRCGCLRDISSVGFVDLNEQALPAIAESHEVRVVRYNQSTTRSLRTLSCYLETLRELNRQPSTRLSGPRQDWEKTFSIVEPGAQVHPTAIIHDSVVLAGARVEADAVVVRSLVCAGATVSARRSEIDAVVTPQGASRHALSL
ncbi:MAG: hypothetical protein AAGH99_11195 [Planctomycetota bacterium]